MYSRPASENKRHERRFLAAARRNLAGQGHRVLICPVFAGDCRAAGHSADLIRRPGTAETPENAEIKTR
jgi:hypothetical protein